MSDKVKAAPVSAVYIPVVIHNPFITVPDACVVLSVLLDSVILPITDSKGMSFTTLNPIPTKTSGLLIVTFP